jgi:hypothetical protein
MIAESLRNTDLKDGAGLLLGEGSDVNGSIANPGSYDK